MPKSYRLRPKRPKSYRTISLSFYHDDLAKLDLAVAALKAREPHPRRRGCDGNMSRSKLIRLLIHLVDLEALAHADPAVGAPPAPRRAPTTRRTKPGRTKQLLRLATKAPVIAALLT